MQAALAVTTERSRMSENLIYYYIDEYTREVCSTQSAPPGYHFDFQEPDENGVFQQLWLTRDSDNNADQVVGLFATLDALAMSVGYNQLFPSHEVDTDIFYQGHNAFKEGLLFSDCPDTLTVKKQQWWKSGFKSAERRSKVTWLTNEECDRVQNEAEQAYRLERDKGIQAVNPYPEQTEAYDIWMTRMMDYPVQCGDVEDDFAVLGKPREVTVIKEHADGCVTYSMPSGSV